MKPIDFSTRTTILLKPENMSDENCESLPVYQGRMGNYLYCLSCWKADWKERISFLLFGKMWVYVLSGHTQPPISVIVSKNVFKELFIQGEANES